jgi:DNA-directed RNA polymerase specialized sigma24 family protein
VAEQDVEAFSAVYRELAKDVHRIAFLVTRDEGLAEDVMQEVFAHVWRESSQLDGRRCGGGRARPLQPRSSASTTRSSRR